MIYDKTRPCLDCKYTGWITLFTSRVPCEECLLSQELERRLAIGRAAGHVTDVDVSDSKVTIEVRL